MSENLELEKTLWQAADKLRNNMDAAEYKHVVLGLIFLKYISDAFEELYDQLEATKHETGADPEDKDEYTAERVFYVPPQARWKWLQGRAKLPTIGKDIDEAMDSIDKNKIYCICFIGFFPYFTVFLGLLFKSIHIIDQSLWQ